MCNNSKTTRVILKFFAKIISFCDYLENGARPFVKNALEKQ